MKKIVVLYSGGLDSYILHHMAKVTEPDAEIQCIYWDHEHTAGTAEKHSLPDFVETRHCEWMSKVNGYFSKEGDPSGPIYIPGRNLVFSVLTACQYMPDEIWLGALLEEDHPGGTDKNAEFLHKTSELLTYVLGPFTDSVKVRTPLVEHNLTKRDAVKWAIENGCTPEELMGTMSCYQQEDPYATVACGNCKQCLRRFAIFGSLGFEETYKQHPMMGEANRIWVTNLIKELDKCNWTKPPLLNDLWWPYIAEYIESNPTMFDDEWSRYVLKSIENNLITENLL
jgi:7-cyano-7-deazaguanine synthase in queuosine biosynthesis